ncbi:DUF6225 family protein [Streptomyces sp. PA03-6a]|nr:DUF6225 family protein [Streptomyces sp. PA03-6a]
MTEIAQTYTHSVQAWTVGRLREELAAYPDDMPLHIAVPDDPEPHPEQTVDDRYVVTGVVTGTREVDSAGDLVDDYLVVDADFPSGEYEQHP